MQQTLPAAELIVVDDGSTDNTAALIAARYPWVVYLQQKNSGVSVARNRGIQQAKSDWIAFLDSDDSWLQSKLARQREALRGTDYLICHTEEQWIRNGRRVNQKLRHAKGGGWMFQKCLPLCAISPSAVLLHRVLFSEVGMFDETLPACEDYDLWLRICARHPVLYVNEPLTIKHGGHADQLSRQYWGMDRFRVIALEKAVQDKQLPTTDREAALHMLLEKLAILRSGALKRENTRWAAELGHQYQRYELLLAAMPKGRKIA